MQLIHDLPELRQTVENAKKSGRTIGVVPTMGALHEGHLSLVRAAQERCDCVAVSIFVNPTQFGPNEDFDKYPRTLTQDCEKLQSGNVDIVFVPEAPTVYPSNCDTFVEPGSVAELWEGKHRPGHFRGVATVVLKLFNMIRADVAFFGQKDFQQVCVLQKMVEDLNVPIELVVCPTVREPDGLALSSRNRYLSPQERKDALVLVRSLEKAEQMIRVEKNSDPVAVRREMEQMITSVANAQIDYIGFADPQTLREFDTFEEHKGIAVLLAVRVGATRLIDNRLI